MKIKANKFKKIINKATISGMVIDVTLDFTETGLKVSHRDPSSIVLSVGFIDKKEFEEYKEMKINIPTISKLLSTLNTFGETVIEFINEENVVILRDAESKMTLAKANVCDYHFDKEFPKVEGANLDIEKDSFDKIFKMAKEVLNVEEINFKVAGGVFTSRVTNAVDSFETTSLVEGQPEASASLNINFIKAVMENIEGKATLTFNNESFAVVIKADDFVYAIAKLGDD